MKKCTAPIKCPIKGDVCCTDCPEFDKCSAEGEVSIAFCDDDATGNYCKYLGEEVGE